MVIVSLSEFITLESKIFGAVKEKDPAMVWQAIECGAADRLRLYAESRNYNVSLDEMVQIMWAELCYHAVVKPNNMQ